MKPIAILLILIVSLLTVAAVTYEYYMVDYVSGRNINLIYFNDDLGIISSLVDSEMIKSNGNIFTAKVTQASDGEQYYNTVSNFKFYGSTLFDDKSTLKYSLTNFTVIDTSVDEYGGTSAYGTATLEYTATIVITKKIPVSVAFDLYEGEDSFGNQLYIYSEYANIYFENFDKQTFTHNRFNE